MAAVLVSVRTTRYPAGSRLAPTVGRQLVRDAKPRRKRSKAGGEAQDEEDVKPPPRKKRKAGFTPEGSLSFASFLLLASLRVAIDEAWLPAYTSTKTPALDALIAAYDTFSAGPNKQIVSAVESKLRKTPYIYLPYRELHTHRRLPPPNLSSSTPQQQFEHHVLLRTGLIAAPKALYRSLPCEGLHSGTVDAWFGSERVQAWYETRGIRQGEEGTNGWGRTNCYGSNARGISFDKRDVFLARRSEVFAAVHGLPFCDALTALHAAALPVFSVGSISGYLAVADLALSGLIQKPKKDEMARCIADLNKGAQVGLQRFGFLAKNKPDAESVKAAFVRFYDAFTSEDEAVSGISPCVRQELLSLGIDLTCPIFVENYLCKAIRGSWGDKLSSGAWLLEAAGEGKKFVGLVRVSAAGYR